jgi:hypothetical protein
MLSKIGFFAFIIGFIIAIVAGFVSAQNEAIVIVLIVLGLIVGFLNITAKETVLFLVATVALLVTMHVFTSLVHLNSFFKYLDQILGYIGTLMAPAAIVVAIKALWAVGKPGES